MTTQKWGGRRATEAKAWTLRRDHGICWICGHPGADTLDHIQSRSEHPELTWDPNNWAAAHGAARPEHDCPGQYARGAYAGPRRPTTPTDIHVIVGPPAGGKTTHVQQHAQPGDLIVDHDTLATALGSPHAHTSHGVHATAARTARDAVIQLILDRGLRAWIIHTAPTAAQISDYTRAHAQPTLIDPGKGTCIHRATTLRQGWTIAAITDWYAQHQHRLTAWATTPPPHPTGHHDGQREW